VRIEDLVGPAVGPALGAAALVVVQLISSRANRRQTQEQSRTTERQIEVTERQSLDAAQNLLLQNIMRDNETWRNAFHDCENERKRLEQEVDELDKILDEMEQAAGQRRPKPPNIP